MEDFLKQIPIFSLLNKEERIQLMDIIGEKRFPKDSTIIHKGQIGNELYVIRSGAAKVILPGKEGHEITLSVLNEGDFFGEMSLFDDEEQPRSATVITTIESHLLVIKRKDFMELAKNSPHIAFEILRRVIKRLRRTDEQIAGLSFVDIYGQLARYREAMDTLKDIYETKLRASETMFEQTRQSAENVIKNAEISRSRVTYVVTTLVAIFAILGGLGSFFGIGKLSEIYKISGDVKKDAAIVTELRKTVEGELQRYRKSIDKLSLAVLDQALEEAWTDEKSKDEDYEKKVENAVQDYISSMKLFGDFSLLPFLNVIEDQLIDAIDAKDPTKDFKKIIKEAVIARDHAKNPTDEVLARYLLIIAYLLDPKEHHDEDIAKTRSELEGFLKKEGFDRGVWSFKPDYYPEGKRDKIKELQDLIESYSG